MGSRRNGTTDPEVADADPAHSAGDVEPVVAVPVPKLGWPEALGDRAGPMVALEVEALGRRRGDSCRLLEGEVDDPEVGDVLVRLVELDAERVRGGMRETPSRCRRFGARS